MTPCPNCNSDGYITGVVRRDIRVTCDICKGRKVLPEGMVYDPEKGLTLKRARLGLDLAAGQPITDAIHYTLRQWCLKYGIDATERSRQEKGFFHV